MGLGYGLQIQRYALSVSSMVMVYRFRITSYGIRLRPQELGLSDIGLQVQCYEFGGMGSRLFVHGNRLTGSKFQNQG